MKEKTCESCGKAFPCSAEDGNCWCRALPVAVLPPGAYQDCLCSDCLKLFTKPKTTPKLLEGVDFYFEGDLMIFKREYHLKRGYCCKSSDKGCRHCPYR